jgi:hypothetical protein
LIVVRSFGVMESCHQTARSLSIKLITSIVADATN